MSDPNQGELSKEELSPPSSVVIPVCDTGPFTVTNADKDEE